MRLSAFIACRNQDLRSMLHMNTKRKEMKRFFWAGVFALQAVFSPAAVRAQGTATPAEKPNAGLALPTGFSATVVADKLGKARHLVVTPQGDIFVRLARAVDEKG